MILTRDSIVDDNAKLFCFDDETVNKCISICPNPDSFIGNNLKQNSLSESKNQNSLVESRNKNSLVDSKANQSSIDKFDKTIDKQLMNEVKKYNLITNFKQVDRLLICDVRYDCPWNTHKNNNRYLIVNPIGCKIILKCHSDKCSGKYKIFF